MESLSPLIFRLLASTVRHALQWRQRLLLLGGAVEDEERDPFANEGYRELNDDEDYDGEFTTAHACLTRWRVRGSSQPCRHGWVSNIDREFWDIVDTLETHDDRPPAH